MKNSLTVMQWRDNGKVVDRQQAASKHASKQKRCELARITSDKQKQGKGNLARTIEANKRQIRAYSSAKVNKHQKSQRKCAREQTTKKAKGPNFRLKES